MQSSKSTANHDYSNVFLRAKSDIESLLSARGIKTSEASILVLGCGYNYPDVILWSAIAKQVNGIDVLEAFWKDGFMARYKNFRKNGWGITKSFAATLFNR